MRCRAQIRKTNTDSPKARGLGHSLQLCLLSSYPFLSSILLSYSILTGWFFPLPHLPHNFVVTMPIHDMLITLLVMKTHWWVGFNVFLLNVVPIFYVFMCASFLRWNYLFNSGIQVDIQALAHAVELTRQGAIDSLRFAKGDLFLAFQVT